MPEKHQLVNDPVLAAWGLRLIVINNYLAFYIIDEKVQTVHIIRKKKKKRNWISILHAEVNRY